MADQDESASLRAELAAVYAAIAADDWRTANGYAMRNFVKQSDYLRAAACRDRVKSWKDTEFRVTPPS